RAWIYAKSIVFLSVALGSKSSTSLLVILFLYVTSFSILLYRKRGVARVVGISTALLIGIVCATIAAFPDAFFEMLGKDPTLTGRTELWDLVEVEIAQKPVFGWGYF